MWKRLPFVFLVSIVSLLACPVSGRDRASESSAIRRLVGDEEVTSFVKGFRFCLLIWDKPKCLACEKARDDLEDAAKIMVDSRLPFARVNAADKHNKNITAYFNVTDTPTYTLTSDFGKSAKAYNGTLLKDDFVAWLRKFSRPAVMWCDSELLCRASIVTKHESGFVGSFKSKESPGSKIYEKVAENFHKSDIMMTAYINENETDEFGTVSIKHPDEMKLITNIVGEEELEEWLEIESVPLFGPLHPGNYADYKQRSDNWVILASEMSDFKYHGKHFRNAAIEKRDFYNFVWLDANAYPGFIDRILGVEEFPRVGVVVEGDRRYLMPEKKKITAEAIVDFILNVENGKAVRYIRSEDIPTEEEAAGTLRKVVARTFKSKVLETKVPLVLLVHSPTCAHCIAFIPKLASLAKRLQKFDSEIQFAKFDGVNNDVPSKLYEREYLPALFLTLPNQQQPKYLNLKNRSEEAVLKFLYKYLPEDLSSRMKKALRDESTKSSSESKSKDEL